MNDMEGFAVSALAAGVAVLCIGVWVWWGAKDALVRRLFLFFTAGLAMWGVSLGLLLLTRIFVFNQFIFYAGFFIFCGFFLFVLAYPQKRSLPLWSYLATLPGALVAGLGAFDLFVSGMQLHENGALEPVNGPLMPLYFAMCVTYFSLSLWVLAMRFLASRGQARMQMWYLAFALCLSTGSIVLADIALPTLGIFSYIYAGPPALIVFAGLVAYAIVRHQLLDIRIVIRRSVLYGLLLALIVICYSALVNFVALFTSTPNFFWSALITTCIGIFTVPKLERMFTRMVAERTRELKESHEAQTHIMLDISHNLQTPLAVFQTKLEGLKATVKDGSIEALEESLARLSTFINDFLRLAELEHGGKHLSGRPLDFSFLVEEVLEEIQVIAWSRDIHMASTIEQGLMVIGDADKLREVVLALASNSIKYMREEGERNISFTLAREGGAAKLEVADSGIGIRDADLPRIFERFWRAPGTEHIAGSGLGLAIARHTAGLHSGTLEAQSAQGSGTILTLRLPLIS